MIDRPMRPLFPYDLRNDVVISCTVLSVDRDCSPEITAMVGAGAAVAISDVPFNGPIAGIALGWDGENLLFNPTKAQRESSKMNVTVAATHKKVVMIEAGGDEIPDDVLYNGIVAAHNELQGVLDLIDKMVAEIGKEKFTYEHAAFDTALFDTLLRKRNRGYALLHGHGRQKRPRGPRKRVDCKGRGKIRRAVPEMGKYMEEILYRMQKRSSRRGCSRASALTAEL